MRIREALNEHRDIVVFIFLAATWFLVRHALKAAICQGPCWLEPTDWPILFGFSKLTPAFLVAVLLFFLFAWPTGYTSIIGTIIGIQIGFSHGFSVFEITAVFLFATILSNFFTLVIMGKILKRPGPNRKAWLSRVHAVKKRFGFLGKKNTFAFLAVGNAISSQLYMAALAIAFKTPRHIALFAMILGSVASFFLPLAVLFSAKVLTVDGVTAALLVLVLFAAGGHAVEKSTQ